MEELYKLIPDEYAAVIRSRLCMDKLSEVRIVSGAPVRVCYDGVYFFLTPTGISRDKDKAFIADIKAADRLVMRACEYSLYTVTETLKRGYISVKGGIRVGVCGSGVMTGGEISAVKDFCSVNIRLPHEVKGCASALASRIAAKRHHTLIMSPPGCGKTTVLRDLCRLLSDRNFNVLLCDERYEIAASSGGRPTLDVGACTDVISGTDKKSAIEIAVANMRPDIIIVDELFSGDIACVRHASSCGVTVVATVHAKDRQDLGFKAEFGDKTDGMFGYLVELSGAPEYAVKITETTS